MLPPWLHANHGGWQPPYQLQILQILYSYRWLMHRPFSYRKLQNGTQGCANPNLSTNHPPRIQFKCLVRAQNNAIFRAASWVSWWQERQVEAKAEQGHTQPHTGIRHTRQGRTAHRHMHREGAHHSTHKLLRMLPNPAERAKTRSIAQRALAALLLR